MRRFRIIVQIVIFQLSFQNILSQVCPGNSNSYDLIGQKCIQCDISCSDCFGNQNNQCSKCDKNFYYNKDDNLCVEKCESYESHNKELKECVKCEILGCEQCDSSFQCNKCKDNFYLNQNDGLCYLKENTCNSNEVYNTVTQKCVSSCIDNSVENEQSKICQNLQQCNLVSEYTNYQIQKGADASFFLSNKNIVFYELPCKFYYADQNLQIYSTVELLTQEEVIPPFSPKYIFYQNDDQVTCVGRQKIIIYDLVQEKTVKNLQIDFKQSEQMWKNFPQQYIIIYKEPLQSQYVSVDLLTGQKDSVQHKGEDIYFYLISSKHRMFTYFSFKQNKVTQYFILERFESKINNQTVNKFFLIQQQGYIVEINQTNGMITSELQVGFISKAGIVDNDQGVFYLLISNKLTFYQIDKKDKVTFIPTFTLHQYMAIQSHDVLFYPKLNLMILAYFIEPKLMIYQGMNIWKSVNQVSKITTTGFFFQIQIINSKLDKSILYVFEKSNFCFIELNENLLSINQASIFNYKCINHVKFVLPKVSSIQINNSQIQILIRSLDLMDTTIQLITSNMNILESKSDKFKTSEGYLSYFDYQFNQMNIFSSKTIKKQDTVYCFEKSQRPKLFVQELQLLLYNYQYNRILLQNSIEQKYIAEEQILSIHSVIDILNNDDIFIIQYQMTNQQYKLIIIDITQQKVIYSIQISQIMLNKNEQPIYIKKYNYLLIQNYNFLINLALKKNINDFTNHLYESWFNYCTTLEDKILIVDYTELIIFNLSTLKFEDSLYFDDFYSIEFLNQRLNNQFEPLTINNYIYFIIDYDYIKSFNLDSQTLSSNMITQDASGNEIQKRVFKGFNNDLYLFFGEKVERYSMNLDLLETIQLQTQNFDQFLYYSIQDRYILFASQNNFFKFDTKINKLTYINTPSVQIGYDLLQDLYLFGDNNSYVAYRNLIIHVDQMLFVKQMNSSWNFLSISVQKTDISNFSYSFPNEEPYPLISFNSQNLPFMDFALCSDAYSIFIQTEDYIQYFVCRQEKRIIKINLLQKNIQKEYQFDQKFEIIVFDPQSEQFIFTSESKYLKIFSPSKENSDQITLLKTYDDIVSIDICPKLKKIFIRTKKNEFFIFQNILEIEKGLGYSELSYFILCEDNLIMQYNPNLKAYSFDNGKNVKNELINDQDNYIINSYGCKPIFVLNEKLLVYPIDSSRTYINRGNTFSRKFSFECSKEFTKMYYDLQEDLLVVLNGKTKNIQIFNGLNGVVLYNLNVLYQFNQKSDFFDKQNTLIVILDNSVSLVKYNYLSNKIQNFQLSYTTLSGFICDADKNIIYFYDNYQIYAHNFIDLTFQETLVDEKYYFQKITNINLNKTRSILTVYKENNYVILYDVHETIYMEDLYLGEYYEINFLEFSNFHYIVYNIRSRSLSLFQKNQNKDNYFVNKVISLIFKVAKLIKIGEDKFIYNNQDFLLFARVDSTNSKIITFGEIYTPLSIQEMFYDHKQNMVLFIEYNTNNIFQIDLQKSEQTNNLEITLIFNNSQQNMYFSGVILNRFLSYYSKGNLLVYNIDSKQINIKQLNVSDISMITKLNTEKDKSNNRKENYLNQERLSSVEDNENDQLLLIISQEEKKISIFNQNSLSIQNELLITFIVLNLHVEIERQLIFVVGNTGYTYIYTYELKQIIQIKNPCLHQTKILTYKNYIYVFCPKQLDIYNRATLDRTYSSIKSGLKSLHRIIYTLYKDVFILVNNKCIQVVRFSSNQSNFQIIFEKQQNLLIIANWSLFTDINQKRYLEIIAISYKDIINYKISLEQQQTCTFTYAQTNSQNLNIYTLKNLEKNLGYSSQLLKYLRVEYQNNDQFYQPVLANNLSQDGIKINYYSEDILSLIKWKSGNIFDDSQIINLQINSLSLKIEGDNTISINEKKNMKKILLENIKFVNIEQKIQLQNFDTVIFKDIIFENFIDHNLTNIIQIQNCNNIFISNLIIQSCQFTQTNSIFAFFNSTKVQIQNVIIIDSLIPTVFKFQQIKEIFINKFHTKNINSLQILIEQVQIESSEVTNFDLYKINNGTILRQYGCQYLKFENINLEQSFNITILEILPFTNVLVYQSLNMQILNLNVLNSQNITSKIVSNQVSIESSSFNNIQQLDRLFIKLQTNIFNMNKVIFSQIYADQEQSILQIKNFDRIILENSIFDLNRIQLLQIQNQNEVSEGKEAKEYIKFSYIQINNNKCKTSLIQIQDCQQLQILNSQFLSNSGQLDGGVFSIQNLYKLFIKESEFKSNTSLEGKGGGLFLENIQTTDIQQSIFEKNICSIHYGGAIYSKCTVKNQQTFQLTCYKCTFTKNQAIAGKGGAFFISNINLNMNDSTIIDNAAAIGGGIYYEIMIPDVVRDKNQYNYNKIEKNRCVIYGNNIGSTLRSLQFKPSSLQNKDYSFEINQNTNEIIIRNFQSGSYILLDHINYLDEEGNTLFFDDILNSNLNPEIQKEIENLSISIENSPQISQTSESKLLFQGGLVSKYTKSGFNFNISLSYQPEKNDNFQLASSLISGFLDSNGKQYIKEQIIQITLQVDFRKCKLGEIKKQVLESITCDKCPDGKYSINLEDQVCQICPISATSCSGQQINLREGYWRKSEISDIIVPCFSNQYSCQPQDPLSRFGCSEGYIGPLCEQCDIEGIVWDERYSQLLSSAQCSKCSTNLYIIALNGIFFYAFQFIQILFAISRIVNEIQIYLSCYYMKVAGFIYLSKSGKFNNFVQLKSFNFFKFKKKLEQSQQNPAFQKILIDHLQIISIASSFQLQLPSIFTYSSETVGNPLQIASTSFDCFFDVENITLIPFWFFKFIWSILLPLILLISYLILHKVKQLLKMNFNHQRYNSTAIIYIYLFLFPSMITLITKSINCRSIGDDKYAQIDISIKCRDYEDHGQYVYFYVLPFGFIFAILLPLILLLKIRNERKSNKSKIIQSRYKFLYDPYKDQLYFWEVIKLGFKSIIMMSSILLYEYPAIKIKNNLKFLAKFRVEKEKNEAANFSKKFTKFMNSSVSMQKSIFVLKQFQSKPQQLNNLNSQNIINSQNILNSQNTLNTLGNENQQLVNSECNDTEQYQPNLLKSKYISRSPNRNSKNSMVLSNNQSQNLELFSPLRNSSIIQCLTLSNNSQIFQKQGNSMLSSINYSQNQETFNSETSIRSPYAQIVFDDIKESINLLPEMINSDMLHGSENQKTNEADTNVDLKTTELQNKKFELKI